MDDGGSEVVPVTDLAAVRAERDWERGDFVVRLKRRAEETGAPAAAGR